MCNAPLTPGATFCPHCGARVEHGLDDDAAATGRVVDDEGSRGMWLLVAAIVAVVGIVAVVAIALASTSGGGGGNAPGTSVSPATNPPATTSRPQTTRPPVTTPRST
jgi:hypothetical protein